jgi:hypothetical protein
MCAVIDRVPRKALPKKTALNLSEERAEDTSDTSSQLVRDRGLVQFF